MATSSAYQQGKQGEHAARSYLEKQGLTFVAANFRCQRGEIDLIMKDGDTLVFVEVKKRKNDHFGSALESVTPRKQHKIRLAAEYFLQQSPKTLRHQTQSLQTLPSRFDVVGICAGQLNWIRNAF